MGKHKKFRPPRRLSTGRAPPRTARTAQRGVVPAGRVPRPRSGASFVGEVRLIDGQLHADEAAVAYFTAVQDRILAAGAVDCLPSPPPTPAVPGSASPVADTALFGDKPSTPGGAALGAAPALAPGAFDGLADPPPTAAAPGSASPVAEPALFGDRPSTPGGTALGAAPALAGTPQREAPEGLETPKAPLRERNSDAGENVPVVDYGDGPAPPRKRPGEPTHVHTPRRETSAALEAPEAPLSSASSLDSFCPAKPAAWCKRKMKKKVHKLHRRQARGPLPAAFQRGAPGEVDLAEIFGTGRRRSTYRARTSSIDWGRDGGDGDAASEALRARLEDQKFWDDDVLKDIQAEHDAYEFLLKGNLRVRESVLAALLDVDKSAIEPFGEIIGEQMRDLAAREAARERARKKAEKRLQREAESAAGAATVAPQSRKCMEQAVAAALRLKNLDHAVEARLGDDATAFEANEALRPHDLQLRFDASLSRGRVVPLLTSSETCVSLLRLTADPADADARDETHAVAIGTNASGTRVMVDGPHEYAYEAGRPDRESALAFLKKADPDAHRLMLHATYVLELL